MKSLKDKVSRAGTEACYRLDFLNFWNIVCELNNTNNKLIEVKSKNDWRIHFAERKVLFFSLLFIDRDAIIRTISYKAPFTRSEGINNLKRSRVLSVQTFAEISACSNSY